MAANTAKGAENRKARTITFKNEEHKKFYKTYLQKCRYQDVYHKALVYCLGIGDDTRTNVNRIYDFKTGCVKTECLQEGWQTSDSMKIVHMAFNLYCNGTPSIFDIEDAGEQLQECRCYTVGNLFCCGYAISGRQSESAIRSIVFSGMEELCQEMFCHIRHLKHSDQTVVLQTMEALIDGLRQRR